MKDDKPNFTPNDLLKIGGVVLDILKNYSITVNELINSMQVYAEWKDVAFDATLEETLQMEDGTPMTPALTRYLYHQMYGLSDLYEDEEDGDDE